MPYLSPTQEEIDLMTSQLSSRLGDAEARLEALEIQVADLLNSSQPSPITPTEWGYNLTSPTNLESVALNLGYPQVVRLFFSGSPGSGEPTWALGKTAIVSFKFNPTQAFPAEKLRAFLASKPANVKAYVCTYHEPEDNITANQFTAAQYRDFVTATTSVCREFENCISTPILMQWTLESASGRNVNDYLEGVEYDVLGWDVYPRLGTIKDIQAQLKSIHDESVKRGKPWLIGEVGAVKYVEGRQYPRPSYTEADRAVWMLNTVAQIKALAVQPLAVCWFTYPTDGHLYTLESAETQNAMKQILANG